MYQITLLNYYLVGRVIFAVALQIAFHFAGGLSILDNIVLLIGLYGFIALIRLIINPEKAHPLDFGLDIVFTTGIIYTSLYMHSYTYLTLLYLFPIFFSSLSIKTMWRFFYPIQSIVCYSLIYLLAGTLQEKGNLINISLHMLAFFLIFFAGTQVNNKLSRQEVYIKRLEEEKIRMQGYERLFRVSADLAHELRNPLASISAAVQFIKEGKDPSDFIDMLTVETERMSRLINEFLIFSRPSDAPKEEIDLSGLIKQAALNNNMKSVEIDMQIKEGLILWANKTFLEAAIGNIIKNACEAAKKRVSIVTKERADIYLNHKSGMLDDKFNNKDFLSITVEDDGKGIDDTVRDKIFEPFVTTKQNGTGLGLAIAYRIITDIGGNIILDKSRLGGAGFTILLPHSAGNGAGQSL